MFLLQATIFSWLLLHPCCPSSWWYLGKAGRPFTFRVYLGNLLPNKSFKMPWELWCFSCVPITKLIPSHLFLPGFLQGYQTMLNLSTTTQVIIQAPFCHEGSLASLFILHVTSKFRCLKSAADMHVISSKINAGTLVFYDIFFLKYINRS